VASPFHRSIGMIAGVAGLVAGCALGAEANRTSPLRPAQTSLPRGTDEPQAKGAVQAYEAFNLAVIEAQRKPIPPQGVYPKPANFALYSFDPIASEFQTVVRKLSLDKQEFRGPPPTSNIRLSSIDPDAAPWPTVTLSDCQTGREDWKVFDTRTNKPVADQRPRIESPYGMVVTVIFNREHWGVNAIRMDPSRKC
jgi:hypothetical protein